MKKISKIVDVLDNWGGTEEYNTTDTPTIGQTMLLSTLKRMGSKEDVQSTIS